MPSDLRWGIGVPQIFPDGPIDMSLVRRWIPRAEQLGFDSLWTMEGITGDLPTLEPVTLLSYMSALTERVKLGVSVIIAPHRNPVQLAKALGSLDTINDGRLIVGIGLGHQVMSDTFGISADHRVSRFVEIMDVMKALWTETEAKYSGRFWQLEGTKMEPKPVQKPHPPLWIAGGQPASFKPAGEMGLGMMCFSIPGFDELGARINSYREGLENAKPVGKFINDQFAATVLVHCAESDQEAREVAGPEAMWFLSMAAALYDPWKGREVPDSYKHHVEAINSERVDRTLDDQIRAGAFAFGNPDTVSRILEEHEKLGVDQIMCIMQIGELSHQRIMNSIKLFGRYVIPHFQQKAAEAH